MKIDVIIPAYRPDPEFGELLRRLEAQTVRPDRILVINTEKQYWDPSWEELASNLEVRHIQKEEFDHGGTRRMAVELLQAQEQADKQSAYFLDGQAEDDSVFYLCMTQDALPADDRLIWHLATALQKDPSAGVSYARQLARQNAGILEKTARKFNYPAESHTCRKEDVSRFGIKTYFCSNVCAMWRKEAYEEAGGFVERAVFNEDMILCAEIVKRGWHVVYAADAAVCHSHDYTLMQQFHRNFDIGVSQAEHPEIFKAVPSEGEGMRLIRYTARTLAEERHFFLLFYFGIQCLFKYAGYFLGKHYQKLPGRMIRSCSMNPGYFEKGLPR